MQDESRLSKLHESWKKVEKFRDLKSPLLQFAKKKKEGVD